MLALHQPAAAATGVIYVEKDVEGVQMAARDLLEEAFQRSRIERSMALADKETREQLITEGRSSHLSPGYYERVGYLFDLRASMKLGIQYGAGDLTRDDVRGLLAIDRAHAEFRYDHPECSGCGTRQDDRFPIKCPGCGVEFRRAGA